MTSNWLRRRLTHTCSVYRDVGTSRSASGQVIASSSAVATAQICRFAEQGELDASENEAEVQEYDALMLLPTDAPVQNGDTLNAITYNGASVAAGTYSVEALLKRRNWRGQVYHLSAGLERIDTQ